MERKFVIEVTEEELSIVRLLLVQEASRLKDGEPYPKHSWGATAIALSQRVSDLADGRDRRASTLSHALDLIAVTLSGQDWDSDTLSQVAGIVRSTGRTVADKGEQQS